MYEFVQLDMKMCTVRHLNYDYAERYQTEVEVIMSLKPRIDDNQWKCLELEIYIMTTKSDVRLNLR